MTPRFWLGRSQAAAWLVVASVGAQTLSAEAQSGPRRLEPVRPSAAAAAPAAAPPATPANAAVRVACEGEAANAAVYINGEFRGDCPLDVSVAAGAIELRVVKRVDERLERAYQQEFRMTANTARRFDVELGAPQTSRDFLRAQDVRWRQHLADLQTLKKRAEAGDGAAALQAAQGSRSLIQLHARMEGRDPAEIQSLARQAIALEDQAAAQGHLPAMVAVAQALEEGSAHRGRNPARALELYAKAAAGGNAAAMGGLAAMHANGWGTPRDDAVALGWLQKGAEREDGRSMFGLATFHRTGRAGLTPDPAAFEQWLGKAVAKGEPRAIVHSGQRLRDGNGVAQDQARAVQLFASVADAWPAARFLLGRAYLLGEGVPRDPVRALTELTQAADSQNPQALLLLGSMHQQGQGTAVNLPQSLAFFRRSAELGEPAAMTMLGNLHQTGLAGAARDPALALDWYRKAAALGDATATKQLEHLARQ